MTAPMDLMNPFDPATIDTEYKAGDDMLYFQYLQDGGNDETVKGDTIDFILSEFWGQEE